MADRTFETELERLFGEHPAFSDADLFALRVETSLERGWTFRRLLIGSLGLAGSLFAVVQLMGYGVAPKLQAFLTQNAPTIRINWTEVDFRHVLPGGLEVNGEVIWMTAAMAVVAVGFALTRAIREI